ncbi:MAG: hypothetical protein IIC50_00795 [Planctomycetes bacterium]|nr:hypothetical protein [Planctomycetota bacterium]
MSEGQDREELLSNFVDGELSERQAEEVERLAEQEEAICQRINQLKNLKRLLAALPRFEAPPDLNDALKAQLARNVNFDHEKAAPVDAPRRRHAVLGRIGAAAAIVVIVIALWALIHSTRKPFKEELPLAGPLEISPMVPAGQAVSGGLVARLELDVTFFSTVDTIMNRAIEYNGLSPYTDKKVEGRVKVYHIRSSRQALIAFLEDFSPAWSKVERASLRLTTEDSGNPLVLESLSADQMQQIFQRESAGQSVDFARRLVDRLQELTREHLDLAAARVPNPMLTSRESAAPPPIDLSGASGELTELTIVLRPSKD